MTDNAIEVRHLTRTFGSHRGIDDVSFAVERGEIFGFLGPNGAGKSTTIRIILGLIRADSGLVQTLGFDPTRSRVDLLRHVGYVPGELAMPDGLTGRKVLDRFAHLRAMTDLSLRDELVEEFSAELDRPLGTLSKGNRQKIGIVAGFMHRPELLVLDEPTSGLDPLLQRAFLHLVRRSTEAGATVLLSSHDLDEVQRAAHRMSIIREGRIVVTDTIEGLRGMAPRIIKLQFAAPTDPAPFARLDGVEVTEVRDAEITLSVTGRIAPALQCAAHLDVVDLLAPRTDLDALFLRYYRNNEGNTDAA